MRTGLWFLFFAAVIAAFIALAFAGVDAAQVSANLTASSFVNPNYTMRVEGAFEADWIDNTIANVTNLPALGVGGITTNSTGGALNDLFVVSNTYRVVYRLNYNGTAWNASVYVNMSELGFSVVVHDITTNASGQPMNEFVLCTGSALELKFVRANAGSWANYLNASTSTAQQQGCTTNASNTPLNDIWGLTSSTLSHYRLTSGTYPAVDNITLTASCSNAPASVWTNDTLQDPNNWFVACNGGGGTSIEHFQENPSIQRVGVSDTWTSNASTDAQGLTSNETGANPRFMAIMANQADLVRFIRHPSVDLVRLEQNTSGSFSQQSVYNFSAPYARINTTITPATACNVRAEYRWFVNMTNGSNTTSSIRTLNWTPYANYTVGGWNTSSCTFTAHDNFTLRYLGTNNFSAEFVAPLIRTNVTALECNYRIIGFENWTARNTTTECVIAGGNSSSQSSINFTLESYAGLSLAAPSSLPAALAGAVGIVIVVVATRIRRRKTS